MRRRGGSNWLAVGLSTALPAKAPTSCVLLPPVVVTFVRNFDLTYALNPVLGERSHRQQQIGWPVRSCMNGIRSGKTAGGTVHRIIVREPADSLEISPLEGHGQAVTARQEQAGGPDFDVDRIDLAGLHLLNLVMRVMRPPFRRPPRVEFALRNPQPAL